MVLLDGIYGDYALILLRLAVGVIFLVHGVPKLKHLKSLFAVVGILEVVGALSVISGYRVEIGALLLAFVMLGALYMKIFRWRKPFTGDGGWELDLTLLASTLAIALIGAGKFSIVNYIG